MDELNINRLIDDALDSVSAIERANPKPFLYTRVMARMAEKRSFWSKAAMFFSKPQIALPAIALLVIINISAMLWSSKEQQSTIPASTIESGYATMNYSFDNMTTEKK
ncbi:hypothetical protein [Polluticaenibacter yanchengensis]|uniref:Uncharacterized protein n=1 Tax=Polluticaenibacter yanchengensis TaxID=3014562 RepID=A0ABT4UJH0_9BACT|nr:hypothetical protein [Chitinophagaceae bacterium LY-5]